MAEVEEVDDVNVNVPVDDDDDFFTVAFFNKLIALLLKFILS